MSNRVKTWNIGDFVRLVVPEDRKRDCFTQGRVLAVETYKDMNGKRIWVYVRWHDADGKPDSDTTKHAIEELESA